MKDSIIKFLLWMNIITLIIAIFLSSTTYFVVIIILNIVFDGTYLIVSKFSHVFDVEKRVFGPLGNILDIANNMGGK